LGFAAGRNVAILGYGERKVAFLSTKTSSEIGKAEQWLLRSLLIRKDQNECGQQTGKLRAVHPPQTPENRWLRSF
jgi:hypothetical protein